MKGTEKDISELDNLGGDLGPSPGNFDYTQWRREHFGNMEADVFLDTAVAYAKEHPYQLKSEKAEG